MLNDRKKKYHMDNIHPLSNSTKDQYLLRPATLWGIPYVKEALYIFEEQYPHEVRLSQSLNVAIQYAQGEKRGQNLRRTSMAPFKVGKEVSPEAKFVSKAASAISSVSYTHTDLHTGEQGWRQARHILGPIVYSAYALELFQGDSDISEKLIQQAVQDAPNEVSILIKNFPKQPTKTNRLDILFSQLDSGLRSKKSH